MTMPDARRYISAGEIRVENPALRLLTRLKPCSGLLATDGAIVTNYPLAANCYVLVRIKGRREGEQKELKQKENEKTN